MKFSSSIDVGIFIEGVLKGCERLSGVEVFLVDREDDWAGVRPPFVGVYAVSGEVVEGGDEFEVERIEFLCVVGAENLRGKGAATFGDVEIGVLELVEKVRHAIWNAQAPEGNLESLDMKRWKLVDVKKGLAIAEVSLEARLFRAKPKGGSYGGYY